MIKSVWKVEFVTAAATHVFLDHGDLMEAEPEFAWTQSTVVSAPIFAPFASAYPLGGAPGQTSWTRIRDAARPDVLALTDAEEMPWGQPGYMRVSLEGEIALVYTRSALKSVVPKYNLLRGRLVQQFTADLGPPSRPKFVAPELIVSTRAVGEAGTILNPTISGGLAAYVVTLHAGALPPGYSLSSAGVITGTPTTAGNYAWSVKLADSRGATCLYHYTFTVT
jgi:hypothetical protein